MIIDKRQIDVDVALDHLGIIGGRVMSDNLVTTCPWPENHREGDAHASFAVSQKTGAWICWASCGQGSLLSLVRRILNVEFREAKTWLLVTAGGAVSFSAVEQALDLFTVKEDKSNEIAKIASADYSLMHKDVVSSYLLERGFTVETVQEWGIRHDRGANAAVIPVYSRDQEIVGVVRRMVPPVKVGFPKYLYTRGFDKNQYLFGLHKQRGNDIIVVEGPLDAIWLHQCGYAQTVALMGASCSMSQLQLLKDLGNRVVLAFDGDVAGRAAAEKLCQRLRKYVQVELALVPDRLDVQDLQRDQLQSLFSGVKHKWE